MASSEDYASKCSRGCPVQTLPYGLSEALLLSYGSMGNIATYSCRFQFGQWQLHRSHRCHLWSCATSVSRSNDLQTPSPIEYSTNRARRRRDGRSQPRGAHVFSSRRLCGPTDVGKSKGKVSSRTVIVIEAIRAWYGRLGE